MGKEQCSFIKWVKAHKTELIIAGVTVVGTVLVVKNWASIKEIFKSAESIVPDNVTIEPVAKE